MIPDSASDGVLFRRVQSYLAPLEIGGSDAHNAFVVGGLDNDQINPFVNLEELEVVIPVTPEAINVRER